MKPLKHYANCISFLLLCNEIQQILWLRIIRICYLTVSMGQESQHGLAGSSAQGLTRLQSRLIHFWGLVFFQALVVGRIPFLMVVEWRSPFSFWLSTRGSSQPLEVAGSFLLCGSLISPFKTWKLTSSSQWEGVSPSCLLRLSLI